MSRRLGLVVACLVLTAGCNTTLLGEPAATRTETLTPAPVSGNDAGTRQPSDGQSLPPGVYANGTVDLSRLRAAHNRSIEGESYTWVYSRGEVDSWRDNGTEGQDLTRRVRVEGGRVLVEDENLGTLRNWSAYLTGREGFARRAGGEVTDVRLAEPADGSEYAPSGGLLGAFLTNRTVRMETVERDGQRFVRLYTPSGAPPDGFRSTSASAVDVSNYRLTVYVAPDGRIRTVGVEYDREVTDEWTRHVSIRFGYSAIGATTVTRPEWVPADAAGTSTPTTTGSYRELGPSGSPSPGIAGTAASDHPSRYRSQGVFSTTLVPSR